MDPVTIGRVNTVPYVDPYHRDTGKLTTTTFYLDPSERLAAVSQREDSGSCPEDEWHGLVLRASLTNAVDWDGDAVAGQPEPPAALDPEAVKAYLESETGQALLATACDGHSTEWNVSNLVGEFDADACVAIGTILRAIANLPAVYESIWPAEDWLYDYVRGEDLIGRDLDALAEELVISAALDKVLVYDVLEYLQAKQAEQLAEQAEE